MKMPSILIAATLLMSLSFAQAASNDATSSATSAATQADPPECSNWQSIVAAEKIPDKPTLYAFIIKIDGHLADVTVKSSSGNERLDQLGATCMTARWIYKPGMQDGKPVERPWQAQIVWAKMR